MSHVNTMSKRGKFYYTNITELLRSELSSIHKFETFKSLKRKYVCNTDGAI